MREEENNVILKLSILLLLGSLFFFFLAPMCHPGVINWVVFFYTRSVTLTSYLFLVVMQTLTIEPPFTQTPCLLLGRTGWQGCKGKASMLAMWTTSKVSLLLWSAWVNHWFTLTEAYLTQNLCPQQQQTYLI